VYVLDGGFAAVVRDVPNLVTGRYRPMDDYEPSEIEMVKRAREVFISETTSGMRMQELDTSKWRVLLPTFPTSGSEVKWHIGSP
jgi:hypothetical protein